MNKKGLGLITWMFILWLMMLGLAVTQSHVTQEKIYEIKQNLSWKPIELGALNSSDISGSPELMNAMEYYINGLGAAIMELAKWGMEFTYNNPTIPYKLIVILIVLALLFPIIVALVKLLIILFLLIKEFFQSRKEKRRYKR